MAGDDVAYTLVLREAIVVAEKLGTWVFHRTIEARSPDQVLGYLLGRIDDFDRRRARTDIARKQEQLSQRIAAWQRAVRLVVKVREGDYKALCSRLIKDFDRDPSYQHIQYVSGHEVEVGRVESRRLKLEDTPKRKNGRPRMTPVQPLDYKACGECHGAGFFLNR